MKNLKLLTKKFKALGNERRLRIIEELTKYKRLSVGEISDKINLSFRSTSRHLRLLENADFISCEHVGINMYYFISPEAPKEFLNLIKN
jgi:DNA-binding transcriptional ArsR family regulator